VLRPRSPVLASLAVIGAILATTSGSSGATAAACQVVTTVDPGALSPAWHNALESLEREIAVSSSSVCHGVVLILSEDQGGVRVTARAPDGQVTIRRVASPGGLSAVAFGLLVVAPIEVEPERPPPAPLELPPTTPLQPAVHTPPPAPDPWAISVSASTGVRAAFPSNVLLGELDVRADLRIHTWLVTFGLRATPLTLVQRGPFDPDAYQETGLGLGLGRELSFGRSALAITGAASVMYIWLENDSLGESAEQAQLRLAAVARWGYQITHAVRLNAAVDGEIAPSGFVTGVTQPGLVAFPAFTVGGRLGVEVLL